MRHRKAGIKLNRTSSHRKAMFRNMVTSLIKHERIRTTHAKAKAIRSWADHVITLAKRGDLHARRQALAIMTEKNVVHKLFDEMAGRFKDRNGGYTRVVKLERRPGDAAPMSMVELVTSEGAPRKKSFKKKDQPYIEPSVAETAKSAEDETAPASVTSAPDDENITLAEISAEKSAEEGAVATEEEDSDKRETTLESESGPEASSDEESKVSVGKEDQDESEGGSEKETRSDKE